MKDLAKLQARMQRAILENDQSIIDDICENKREERSTLLSIYQHAYGARLTEFLENEFPVLHTWMGDAEFNNLSMAYAKAHPSDHPNARWFGRYFAEFTSNHEGLKSNPECGEIAQLEHALNQAFDAKDTPTLLMADLSTLSPEQWAELTFTPHPSTTRLTLTTNAAQIWTATHKEETPLSAKIEEEAEQVIIWRASDMARFRIMQDDEAMMWDEASKGKSFADLCAMLGTYWPEDQAPMKAAGYLQNWLSSDFLAKPE